MDQMANTWISSLEAELLRRELNALRNRHLDEASFQERFDLIAKLGIKISPSEDLKSRKILCQLNIAK